nr:MAG TPA: hypothetical protein [Caudoviricetes sp.]
MPVCRDEHLCGQRAEKRAHSRRNDGKKNGHY